MADQKTIDFCNALPELLKALEKKGMCMDEFEAKSNKKKEALTSLTSDNTDTNEDLIFLLAKALIEIDSLKQQVYDLQNP